MSDYFAQVEQELRAAAVRRAHMPWYRRLLASSPAGPRVAVIAIGFVFATTAITLAGTGVILTGSPVQETATPSPTVGDGIPVTGATRLLSLRAPDPAGGLPWGMRVLHTTRGLVCVQNGQLGQLGTDGAFHDDGRFHPLPAAALPDVIGGPGGFSYENCASPHATYSGDAVGLMLSAASNPPAGAAPLADRREISFGLLGVHARTITYREGGETVTHPVLPGLGAYLIVQRYTSGRRLGGVSESVGRDEPGNYSGPAGPNGALTQVVYDYAGRRCVVDGSNSFRLRSCGLSEVPAPSPAPLPAVHVPVEVHLQTRGHVITSAELTFRAPYAVTSAEQDYYLSAENCSRGSGLGPQQDVARGALVHVSLMFVLRLRQAENCGRPLRLTVEYVRSFEGPTQPTKIGTVNVAVPRGDHVVIPAWLRKGLERARRARRSQTRPPERTLVG
jgi:hypothetical protein